ncbi:ParB N-terminal domain-containing protein [Dactylosporangium sp. NPDC051485]|uniref:ParB/RepB/Spo0J family partition protein n=1 Tax=Dactylosporangium sp. NPDC051485 TaxID=3154846 RepID=UPI003434C450
MSTIEQHSNDPAEVDITEAETAEADTTATDDSTDDTQPGDDTPTAPTGEPIPGVRLENVDTARLVKHHANVRTNVVLRPSFVKSIKERGVRVALKVKEHPDGRLEIVMGERRLFGAIEAGRPQVPCIIVEAGPLADDFLDMYTENVERDGLTAIEEAQALFRAAEAGASRTKISKSLGLKPDVVRKSIAAGGLSDHARQVVAETPQYEWGLDELAVLAEFDGDPDAVARIAAHARRRNFEYGVNLERAARERRAAREAVITKLAEAGVPISDLPLPGMVALDVLAGRDGEPMQPDEHATCPGHRAIRLGDTSEHPVRFVCNDPTANGHRPYRPSADAPSSAPQPTENNAEDRAKKALIRTGNAAWRAATKTRQDHLRQYLTRKTLPRDAVEFVTRQLVMRTQPVAKWMNNPRAKILADLLSMPIGTELNHITERLATANDKRLMVIQLGVIAAAHEKAMDEHTWRFDETWGEVTRKAAGQWLEFLSTIGYNPAPIERAVIDQKLYTGDDDTATTAADEEPPTDAEAEASATLEPADDDAANLATVHTMPVDAANPVDHIDPEHAPDADIEYAA